MSWTLPIPWWTRWAMSTVGRYSVRHVLHSYSSCADHAVKLTLQSSTSCLPSPTSGLFHGCYAYAAAPKPDIVSFHSVHERKKTLDYSSEWRSRYSTRSKTWGRADRYMLLGVWLHIFFKVGAYERLRDEPAGELCEERLWVQTLQNHLLWLLWLRQKPMKADRFVKKII